MKFIDEATITVQSGDGGRGCVSFRREKFIPRGGPDGGDGGRGGDIIIEASATRRTLYQFRYKKQFKAKNGGHGQGRNKTGRSADDLILQVPPGTIVRDADTGELIHDFTSPDETLVVARGGRGGLGNSRFKTATNRAPRYAQPGEAGAVRQLHLELKLLADVGLIGLPNAGKSTLISAISAARPKIADYPFTTLTPNLGVVRVGDAEPFVVADIPGLIEGAHQGVGLGIRFLKHVERTGILVHLIDVSQVDTADPLAACRVVNHELERFNPGLAEKPQILVLNKIDLTGSQDRVSAFRQAAGATPVFAISAATGTGLPSLLNTIIEALDNADDDR